MHRIERVMYADKRPDIAWIYLTDKPHYVWRNLCATEDAIKRQTVLIVHPPLGEQREERDQRK